MNAKHGILLTLVILMALGLTSACQTRQILTATPSPTQQPQKPTEMPITTEQQPLPDQLTLKSKLDAGEALRIMPLGDAVVEGFCDRPSQCKDKEVVSPLVGGDLYCSHTTNDLNPKAVGFRGFLRDKLATEGIKMTYVGSIEVIEGLAHEGHSHFTTSDIDYCIQNVGWLEQAQPDIILLLVGQTDAFLSESPEQMLQSLEKLLRDIYEKLPETSEVIVAQYPTRYNLYPVSNPFFPENYAETITEYNAGIPGIVEKLRADGKHVSTVNMWDAFQSIDDYDEGGIRPRSVAAERMAQVWLEKIMEILDQPVLVSASPTLQPTPTKQPTPPPTIRADDPLRIMPLGTSLIEGQCDRPSNCIHPVDMQFPRDGDGVEACKTGWYTLNPGERGFREFLRDRLTAARVNMSYVGSVQVIPDLAHEGHTGFMISDLDYCLQEANWLEQAKPDMILIYAGEMEFFEGTPPEDIIDSLRGLLTSIYQKLPESTEVIVAQSYPAREDIHVYWDQNLPLINDFVAGYNALIPGVAEEFRTAGKHVSYVDLQNTIQSPDEYNESGGVPNLAASERIAEVWFEKIMEILGQ